MKNKILIILLFVITSCSNIPALHSSNNERARKYENNQLPKITHVAELDNHELVFRSMPNTKGLCTVQTYNWDTEEFESHVMFYHQVKQVRKGEVIKITGEWKEIKL